MSKSDKKTKKSPAVVEQDMDTQDERLEFLLPGHVWRRSDTGQLSTVLFVTNSYLSPKQQETFPPQVVYVDAAGRKTSVTVDRFLKNRVFENVNPDIELRIRDLLEPLPEQVAVSSETVREEPDPETEQEQEAAVESALKIAFESSSNQQMPELPAQELVDAFLQYEQDPDLINGFVRHKLMFSLAKLSLDQVRGAFGSPGAVYGTFRLTNDQADISVEWQEFQGAYPVIDAQGTYASLVFMTPATLVNVNLEEAPQDEQADEAADPPPAVTFEGEAQEAAPAVTVAATA